MDYLTFCIIIGIMFWVLAAIAVVCLLSFAYVNYMYYQWNKQEREDEQIVKRVSKAVSEKLQEQNSQEIENNS